MESETNEPWETNEHYQRTPTTRESYEKGDYRFTVEGRSDEWVKHKSTGAGCWAQTLIVLVMIATALGATFSGGPKPIDCLCAEPAVTTTAPPSTLAPTTLPPTTVPVPTTLPLFDAGPEFAPPAPEPAPEPASPSVTDAPAPPHQDPPSHQL